MYKRQVPFSEQTAVSSLVHGVLAELQQEQPEDCADLLVRWDVLSRSASPVTAILAHALDVPPHFAYIRDTSKGGDDNVPHRNDMMHDNDIDMTTEVRLNDCVLLDASKGFLQWPLNSSDSTSIGSCDSPIDWPEEYFMDTSLMLSTESIELNNIYMNDDGDEADEPLHLTQELLEQSEIAEHLLLIHTDEPPWIILPWWPYFAQALQLWNNYRFSMGNVRAMPCCSCDRIYPFYFAGVCDICSGNSEVSSCVSADCECSSIDEHNNQSHDYSEPEDITMPIMPETTPSLHCEIMDMAGKSYDTRHTNEKALTTNTLKIAALAATVLIQRIYRGHLARLECYLLELSDYSSYANSHHELTMNKQQLSLIHI